MQNVCEEENRKRSVSGQKVRWRQVIGCGLHWRANQLGAAKGGREAASGAPSQARGLLLPTRLSNVTQGKPGFEPNMKQTVARQTRESSTRSQVGNRGSCAARVGGEEREARVLHFYHAMKPLCVDAFSMNFELFNVKVRLPQPLQDQQS